jgi:hypothetical protein
MPWERNLARVTLPTRVILGQYVEDNDDDEMMEM